MRVLGISGSLRQGSHNTALIEAAARRAPEGVDIELYQGIEDLPHYRPELDTDDAPETVRRLREAIAGADALLIATPEYNGTIPGVLKNVIDWASRPFPDSALRGKPTALVSASTGSYGAVWAQADARKSLGIAGARVLEKGVGVPTAHDHIHPEDGLTSERIHGQLEELVGLLVAEASWVPTAA